MSATPRVRSIHLTGNNLELFMLQQVDLGRHIPLVQAYLSPTGYTLVDCPGCGRVHVHGWIDTSNQIGDYLGFRISHCSLASDRFVYGLILAGEAPDELIKKQRHPRVRARMTGGPGQRRSE